MYAYKTEKIYCNYQWKCDYNAYIYKLNIKDDGYMIKIKYSYMINF